MRIIGLLLATATALALDTKNAVAVDLQSTLKQRLRARDTTACTLIVGYLGSADSQTSMNMQNLTPGVDASYVSMLVPYILASVSQEAAYVQSAAVSCTSICDYVKPVETTLISVYNALYAYPAVAVQLSAIAYQMQIICQVASWQNCPMVGNFSNVCQ